MHTLEPSDPLLVESATGLQHGTRRRFSLEDSGFNEVPRRFRRFYRRWGGEADLLAPNEVLCPICKVVIRSTRELRAGDRVYCMPCMSRLVVVRTASGRLEGRPIH